MGGRRQKKCCGRWFKINKNKTSCVWNCSELWNVWSSVCKPGLLWRTFVRRSVAIIIWFCNFFAWILLPTIQCVCTYILGDAQTSLLIPYQDPNCKSRYWVHIMDLHIKYNAPETRIWPSSWVLLKFCSAWIIILVMWIRNCADANQMLISNCTSACFHVVTTVLLWW